MKNKKHKQFRPTLSKPMLSKQQGAAILGTVLVLLVIVSLVGIAASKSTILETKMVFNMQDKQRSTIAADSAAQQAWNQVKTNYDVAAFINNTDDGYYVLTDEYPLDATAKTTTDWEANKSPSDWPWNDDTQLSVLPVQLGGASNPMQLVNKPQYTIGIHQESTRKGTANYKCNRVSIIGASQGGTAKTRTLIELKTIPKSTCYHEIIK